MVKGSDKTQAFTTIHKKSRWETDVVQAKYARAGQELTRQQQELNRLVAQRDGVDVKIRANHSAGNLLDPATIGQLAAYRQELEDFIAAQKTKILEHKKVCNQYEKQLVEANNRQSFLKRRVSELVTDDHNEAERKVGLETDELFLLRSS